MEKPRYKSPHPVRVTRRLLIITWAWGIASLLAIGGILYSLFQERKTLVRNQPGGPEERLP